MRKNKSGGGQQGGAGRRGSKPMPFSPCPWISKYKKERIMKYCPHGVSKKGNKDFKFAGGVYICRCCGQPHGTFNLPLSGLCQACEKEVIKMKPRKVMIYIESTNSIPISKLRNRNNLQIRYYNSGLLVLELIPVDKVKVTVQKKEVIPNRLR